MSDDPTHPSSSQSHSSSNQPRSSPTPSRSSVDPPQAKVQLPSFRKLFPQFVVDGQQQEQQPIAFAPESARKTEPLRSGIVPDNPQPPSLYPAPAPPDTATFAAYSRQTILPPPSISYSSRLPEPGPSNPPVIGEQKAPSIPPSEEKKHICHVCTKGFSRMSSLHTHYNSHTGEKPFECLWQGCNSRFSVKSNMLRHFRTHTGNE